MSSEEKPRKRRIAQASRSSETALGHIQFVPMVAEKAHRGRVRFRDPENPFNTWGGQGKRPTWLKQYIDEGRVLEEFEV